MLPPEKYRLGLERSHSAEEAISVITDLLESYGQVSTNIYVYEIKSIYCQVSSMVLFGPAENTS